MNFEQLKLQMHMRSLYERLGAMDAELLIVDAFLREQARHDRILRTKQGKDNHARPTNAKNPAWTDRFGGVGLEVWVEWQAFDPYLIQTD